MVDESGRTATSLWAICGNAEFMPIKTINFASLFLKLVADIARKVTRLRPTEHDSVYPNLLSNCTFTGQMKMAFHPQRFASLLPLHKGRWQADQVG